MCVGHPFGWLGCGSARSASLQTTDRCSAAPQAMCVLEKPGPDAATWCPTRLLLGYTEHAPVAII